MCPQERVLVGPPSPVIIPNAREHVPMGSPGSAGAPTSLEMRPGGVYPQQ